MVTLFVTAVTIYVVSLVCCHAVSSHISLTSLERAVRCCEVSPPEKSMDDLLDDLEALDQAAEWRLPYEVPARWPLLVERAPQEGLLTSNELRDIDLDPEYRRLKQKASQHAAMARADALVRAHRRTTSTGPAA